MHITNAPREDSEPAIEYPRPRAHTETAATRPRPPPASHFLPTPCAQVLHVDAISAVGRAVARVRAAASVPGEDGDSVGFTYTSPESQAYPSQSTPSCLTEATQLSSACSSSILAPSRSRLASPGLSWALPLASRSRISTISVPSLLGNCKFPRDPRLDIA